MPRRTTYTDTTTGRFVSGADIGSYESILRSVYDGGLASQQLVSFGQITEHIQGEEYGGVSVEPSRWGGRLFDDNNPLDLNLLENMEMPEGYSDFRVTYHIQQNPDYPRSLATDEWLGADQWPPQMDVLDNAVTTGIAHIVFRKANYGA